MVFKCNEEELTIPVPWGFIKGKTWGDKNNKPILVVHGIQDNAGSFDLLIEKLPTTFYYVCIDLPGHGRSSHFPDGLLVKYVDWVYSLKLVVDHLKWQKFIYLSHSLGSHIGFQFLIIFPEYFEKFICIDAIMQYPLNPENFISMYNLRLDYILNLQKKIEKSSPPVYTYEEILKRSMINRATEICQQGAENMLKRILVPTGDGTFKLSTDQRLKCFLNEPFSSRYLLNLVKYRENKCPHLIILASETKTVYIYALFKEIFKEFKKDKIYKLAVIEGNHDIHNNSPDEVALIITNFLLETNKRKTWGNKTNKPVLCVHGLYDNCGSFDILLTKLPINFYYVCVDLPSHGRSSHFPSHVLIKLIDFVHSLKLVIDHFQWQKFIYLSHSFGSSIGFQLACIYPDNIEKLISLDIFCLYPIEPKQYASYHRQKFEGLIKYQKKINGKRRPRFTYDKALEKIINNRMLRLPLNQDLIEEYLTVRICKEGAKNILDRSIVQVDDGVYEFTNDYRLNFFLQDPIREDYIIKLSEKLMFPYLMIFSSETVESSSYQIFKNVINHLKTKQNFQFEYVIGNHDMHNNSPELVSVLITHFLLERNVKSKL